MVIQPKMDRSYSGHLTMVPIVLVCINLDSCSAEQHDNILVKPRYLFLILCNILTNANIVDSKTQILSVRRQYIRMDVYILQSAFNGIILLLKND